MYSLIIMKFLLLLIFWIISTVCIFSQVVYLKLPGKLIEYNIGTNTYITSCAPLSYPLIHDIDFNPKDNSMILISNGRQIIISDSSTCKSAFKIPFETGAPISNSETGPDGIGWILGRYLMRYNCNTNGPVNIFFNLPIPSNLTGENSTLFFYKDNFYYFSNYGTGTAFVQLDTINPANSKVLRRFDGGVDFFNPDWATSFRTDCDTWKVFVTVLNGIDSGYVCTFDMETYSLTPLFLVHPDILGAGGIGHKWDRWYFDCELLIDLDKDNSTSSNKNDFEIDAKCNAENIELSDLDLYIRADMGHIDSVKIWIDPNNVFYSDESLSYLTHPTISIRSNNDKTFTLIPSQSDGFKEIEDCIRQFKYSNTSCTVSPNDARIHFIAHIGAKTSDTATATIHLSGDFPNAGHNDTLDLCLNDPPIQLLPLLGQCASVNGTWHSALSITNGIYVPSSAEDGTIQYIVGSKECAADTSYINIHVHELPRLELGNDTSICQLIPWKKQLDTSLQYLWNDGTMQSLKTITQSGIYTVEAKNRNGCKSFDTIQILFTDEIHISDSITICKDSSLFFKNIKYPIGSIIHDTLSAQIGCDTIHTIQIKGFPLKAVNITSDSILCKDQKTVIAVSNAKKYIWSTGESTQNITASAGTYSVTLTDENNCATSQSITIKEAPELMYSINRIKPKCAGDYASISILNQTGGITPIKYLLNDIESKDGIFNQLDPGTYLLRVSDALGCEKLDTVFILDATPFDVRLQKNIIELDENSSGIINYNVISGQLKLIHFDPNENIVQENNGIRVTGVADQDYTLTFEDENGCIITKILQIRIKKNSEVYIPQIFSPNGDQVNDIWEPQIGSSLRFVSLIIFDRWGNQIHHSTTVPGWDGNTKNKPVNPGVYVYLISVQNAQGIVKEYYGDLTLIR